MRNKTANIYTEWLPLIENLSDDEAGKIFKSILNYQDGKDISIENPIWIFIKTKLDDYNKKYESKVESRRKAGSLGGLAKASKCYQELANDSKSSNKIKENKIKQNKTKENKTNKKPTLEEIKEYSKQRNRLDLAEKFYDYYQATDWKDKENKPVKNWKAKFITWENHNEQKKSSFGTWGDF